MSLAPEGQTCMVEQQAQTFSSAINGAVVSLADRMRVRRPPEKRARVKHNQITMAQAENAREAWLFAIRNGTPLNTFATVHWGHAPAKAAGLHPVERNGLLRDGLKAWIYRNAPGVPFAWIEVREKTRALGEHVHLVAHVPDHLRERFAKAVDRLVARQSASKPGSIATPPASHSLGSRSAKRRAPWVSTSTLWRMFPIISGSGSPRPLTVWSRASPPASARRRLTFARSARSGGSAIAT